MSRVPGSHAWLPVAEVERIAAMVHRHHHAASNGAEWRACPAGSCAATRRLLRGAAPSVTGEGPGAVAMRVRLSRLEA